MRSTTGHLARRRSDVLRDAGRSLTSKPRRTTGMLLGVVLGVASALMTSGLASTARFQVSDEFDALRSTEVNAQVVGDLKVSLAEAAQTLAELPGVVAAGVIVSSQANSHDVSPNSFDPNTLLLSPRVFGVDSSFLTAMETTSSHQTGMPASSVDLAAKTALLGTRLAQEMGYCTCPEHGQVVYVDGVPLNVIGILDHSERLPQLDYSVVLPYTTLLEFWGQLDKGSIRARVQPGASSGLSEAAAYAINPTDASSVTVPSPPDAGALRGSVDQQLALLGLGISALAVLVGILVIASATSSAVSERIGEFGLRRALGARSKDLTALVLCECAIVGGLAGILGSLLGVAIIVVVSAYQGWEPVVSRAVLGAAPLTGLATGLIAGLFPSIRAGRVQPVEALRR